MARDAQRAAVRRRHLLHVDVVAKAPFPLVGQHPEAMGDAGAAGALALVDARQVGTTDQQVDPRRTGFQRGGGAVHRRGAAADHGHPPALQGARVPVLVRNAPSGRAAGRPTRPAPTIRRVRRGRWPAPHGAPSPGSGARPPGHPRCRSEPCRRPAAGCRPRAAGCARRSRARGGTSAGTPPIAGAESCRARPRPAGRTGPRTRRGRSVRRSPAPARSAPSASAVSPCAPSWPTGPRSLRASGRRRARARPGA